MTIVYIRHVRAASICPSGARRWCESKGFSWRDFLSNGMSADDLEATGDALAHRVSEIARQEAASGGQQ
jgi:hypothetical protein